MMHDRIGELSHSIWTLKLIEQMTENAGLDPRGRETSDIGWRRCSWQKPGHDAGAAWELVTDSEPGLTAPAARFLLDLLDHERADDEPGCRRGPRHAWVCRIEVQALPDKSWRLVYRPSDVWTSKHPLASRADKTLWRIVAACGIERVEQDGILPLSLKDVLYCIPQLAKLCL